MPAPAPLRKAKIHRACITECSLDYEGSFAVDLDILDTAGILPHERILLVNITNGERLETYAIPAERGSKTFCLNGAAVYLLGQSKLPKRYVTNFVGCELSVSLDGT